MARTTLGGWWCSTRITIQFRSHVYGNRFTVPCIVCRRPVALITYDERHALFLAQLATQRAKEAAR